MKIINFFRVKIYRFIQRQKIKEKINEAEHLAIITGRRHFVVPVGKNSFGVVNSLYPDFFNKHRSHGQAKMNYNDLVKMSIYKTK